MKKIVILGTGGNSIDILDTLLTINQQTVTYECLGFLDDNILSVNKVIFGYKVLGRLSSAQEFPEDVFFINGIGSPSNFWKKMEIIQSCRLDENRFESIVHPTASISNFASIGKGCAIFQNVVITSNARIGNHVCILPGSVISHDCSIGAYTSVAAGVCLSGGVRVKESCYLGTNSSVIGDATIGRYSMIGMCTNVLSDVDEKSVMIGNPARFLRSTF